MVASSCMTVSVSCCSLAISSATAFSILARAEALAADDACTALVLAAVCDDRPVGESVPPVGDSRPVTSDSLLADGDGDSLGPPPMSDVCRDLCRKFAGTSSSDVLSSRDNHSTYQPTVFYSTREELILPVPKHLRKKMKADGPKWKPMANTRMEMKSLDASVLTSYDIWRCFSVR